MTKPQDNRASTEPPRTEFDRPFPSWERRREIGYYFAYLDTLIDLRTLELGALLKSFRKMPADGEAAGPIAFAILHGFMVAALLFLSVLGPTLLLSPLLPNPFDVVEPIVQMSVIFFLPMLLIITAAVLSIATSITLHFTTKAETRFDWNFRVTAYCVGKHAVWLLFFFFVTGQWQRSTVFPVDLIVLAVIYFRIGGPIGSGIQAGGPIRSDRALLAQIPAFLLLIPMERLLAPFIAQMADALGALVR